MENKEVIRNLYANVFNTGETALLDQIVSPDYENSKGMKGVEAFKKTVTELTTAFPDAKWTLTAIVAEGNQVFIRHELKLSPVSFSIRSFKFHNSLVQGRARFVVFE